MSLATPFATARRVIVRETAGRVLRAKVERANNTDQIVALVMLRAKPGNLQPEDFRAAAADWKVDPATLHALADAESSGGGFDAEGRAIIAVECHAFSDATLHAFDVSHPHLSYPEWVQYKRGAPPPKGMQKHPYVLSQDDRWGLFAQQAELSIEGACSALSVGRFQQLIGRTPADRRKGRKEAWRELGFPSAEALFRKLCASEFDQLEVLRLFLEVHGLMNAFRQRDWRVIAARYNGTGQVDVYSERMAKAFKNRLRTYA